jgi:hypothetical protein
LEPGAPELDDGGMDDKYRSETMTVLIYNRSRPINVNTGVHTPPFSHEKYAVGGRGVMDPVVSQFWSFIG